MSDDIWSIPVTSLKGEKKDLSEHKGKVLLVVNTASQCGFTPQYKGLEELWKKYRERGLVVLGFPCNQFGNQEPGDAAAIGEFCSKNFGVTFPLYAKVDVNGAEAHPLFQKLKSEARGLLWTQAIKWNFTKFLVDRNGNTIDRFGPSTSPESLEGKIEEALGPRVA
jgi:glutathione peroxidase